MLQYVTLLIISRTPATNSDVCVHRTWNEVLGRTGLVRDVTRKLQERLRRFLFSWSSLAVSVNTNVPSSLVSAWSGLHCFQRLGNVMKYIGSKILQVVMNKNDGGMMEPGFTHHADKAGISASGNFSSCFPVFSGVSGTGLVRVHFKNSLWVWNSKPDTNNRVVLSSTADSLKGLYL